MYSKLNRKTPIRRIFCIISFLGSQNCIYPNVRGKNAEEKIEIGNQYSLQNNIYLFRKQLSPKGIFIKEFR